MATWALKTVGLLVIAISLICLIAPYKVFTWREEWKLPTMRTENLRRWEIKTYIGVMRIFSILGLAVGVWMIFFLKPQ